MAADPSRAHAQSKTGHPQGKTREEEVAEKVKILVDQVKELGFDVEYQNGVIDIVDSKTKERIRSMRIDQNAKKIQEVVGSTSETYQKLINDLDWKIWWGDDWDMMKAAEMVMEHPDFSWNHQRAKGLLMKAIAEAKSPWTVREVLKHLKSEHVSPGVIEAFTKFISKCKKEDSNSKQAVIAFLESLNRSPSPYSDADTLVIKINPDTRSEVMNPIIGLLKSDDKTLRKAAREALERIGLLAPPTQEEQTSRVMGKADEILQRIENLQQRSR